MLSKLAYAGISKKNACRNLHVIINQQKLLFPVKIDAVPVRVALRRPYLRKETLYWPVLRMKDWIDTLFQKSPESLLGGCKLSDIGQWQSTLSNFWSQYQECHNDHAIFASGLPLSNCIPYFLHGDEGKILRSRSMMIESFQPVISKKGINFSNESGFLGLHVLLKFCI